MEAYLNKFSVICLIMISMFFCFSEAKAYSEYYETESSYESLLKTNRQYDYLYVNPPKKKLHNFGYYFGISSGVTYSHSPSKLKGIRHAARINANNAHAYKNYY